MEMIPVANSNCPNKLESITRSKPCAFKTYTMHQIVFKYDRDTIDL